MKQQYPPELDLAEFAASLARACLAVCGEPPRPVPAPAQSAPAKSVPAQPPPPLSPASDLSPATVCALHAHYAELRRWNRRLTLIGPGTVHEVLERHYAESLAALPFLPPPRPSGATDRSLVLADVGSGAGFPGWVLGAARLDLTVLLVEARERKWAFLQAATRRADAALLHTADPGRADGPTSLPIHCLNARVGVPLPEALPPILDIVTARALRIEPRVLAALARRLIRQGQQGKILLWLGADAPRLPPELVARREQPLGGSEHRRILELVPAP